MKMKTNPTPLRTALIYAFFGAVWILLSDTALNIFIPQDSPNHILSQTIKGWLFVLASASLLYLILSRDMKTLQKKQEQIRYQAQLVENVSDAIISSDMKFHIQSWNAAAERMYGWKASEVLGHSVNEFIQHEYISTPREEILKTAMEQGRWMGEVSQSHKDGRRFFVLASISLVKDEDGRSIGFVAVNHDMTEIKRTQEEAAILARFPEENPNPVMRVDLNGRLIYANKASAPLLELWGCEVNGYLPQEYAERIAASTTGSNPNWPDLPCGNHVFSMKFAPIYGENFVNIYAMDITERKRAEENLRESEANLSALIENTDGSIWAVDKQYGLIVGNGEFHNNVSAVLGRRLEMGESVLLPNFPPQANTEWQVYYDRALQGEHFTNETQTRFREAPHYIEYRFSPICEETGEIRGVTIFGRDITERKQAEEKLKYQAHLLANVNDAIVASDKNYSLTAWNTAAENIYGWKASEVLGRNGTEIIQTIFSDQDKEKVLASISANGFYRGEATQIRKDGTRFPVDLSSIVLHDNQGQITGFVSVNRDITERKLVQEQLLKTLEELKRSNSELEQFAYVASHDLQEPLRAVAGMVQLLQKRYHGKLDERADEYIDLAMDGANRMQTLITDLLEYSRVNQRGNPIQPADANEALKSALRNLHGAIQQGGATISNGTLPMVEADATQLAQLFQNLIGNAIKFHSETPPKIHIGVEDLEDAWRFHVRDNGIGIEPQYFERIFLVFQRLHTRREYPGTGIGLSICKKIVERHGGRIWIESEPGQGTTFYFTIPHRS